MQQKTYKARSIQQGWVQRVNPRRWRIGLIKSKPKEGTETVLKIIRG